MTRKYISVETLLVNLWSRGRDVDSTNRSEVQGALGPGSFPTSFELLSFFFFFNFVVLG